MIREMKRFETNSFLKCLQFLLILLVSLLFVLPAYSEGFKLKKVGSHYEPELHYELSQKSIIIPGTDIKVGAFKYVTKHGDEVPKLGFLIGDQFYFVQEDACSCGDANFGATRRYLVIDGYAYGASHNRSMYLFKYDKSSIQFLDIIGQTEIGSSLLDFVSAYPGKQKYGYLGIEYPPAWIELKDLDGNGKPEIRIGIFIREKYPPDFELYLEIINDKLKVNFNPKLYKPLFDNIRRKYQGKKKHASYYIIGFLAKQMNLKNIKTELAGDKNRSFVIELLENVDKWNSAFHDTGKNVVLLHYNLNRR